MNSLDQTVLKVVEHSGLKSLEQVLKNDLKTVFKEPESIYCTCEQPEFEKIVDDYDDKIVTWFCINCETEANPHEPEYDSYLL